MKKNIRYTRADVVFLAIDWVLLSLVLLILAYPLLYVVSASLSSTQAVMAGRVWIFPVEFSQQISMPMLLEFLHTP